MAKLELSFGIKTLNDDALDAKYLNGKVPYVSINEVNSIIPIDNRNIGLTVNINRVEYWYKEGKTDNDLVLKTVANQDLSGKVDKVVGERLINAAEITKLSNQSGVNTGDQDLSVFYTKPQVDAKVTSIYRFRGNVANYASLPSTGLVIGDVYNLTDTGANWAWTGTVWDNIGNTIDISGKVDKVVGERLINAAEINKLSNQSGINTGDQDLSGKVDRVIGERLINATEITKLSNQSGVNTGDQDLSGKVDKVTGERLINAAEITKLSNQSGVNTGDQDLSGKQDTILLDDSLYFYNGILSSNISLITTSFVWKTGNSTIFSLPFAPTNLIGIYVNGLKLYNATQYNLILPNRIQVLQTLNNNDVIDFIYEHFANDIGNQEINLTNPFDYLVVRFVYQKPLNGTDLDLMVYYDNTNTIYDKDAVGYNQVPNDVKIPNNLTEDTDAYLWWATDDYRSPEGECVEAVVIGFNKFNTNVTTSGNKIEAYLRAGWYNSINNSVGNKNVTIEVETYLRGEMSISGTNIINTGGVLSNPRQSKNINVTAGTGQVTEINSNLIGVITYDKTLKTAILI